MYSHELGGALIHSINSATFSTGCFGHSWYCPQDRSRFTFSVCSRCFICWSLISITIEVNVYHTYISTDNLIKIWLEYSMNNRSRSTIQYVPLSLAYNLWMISWGTHNSAAQWQHWRSWIKWLHCFILIFIYIKTWEIY